MLNTVRPATGVFVLVAATWAVPAAADPTTIPASDPPAIIDTTDDSARIAQELERSAPPPSRVFFFQYGVAFTSEQILDAGPICDDLSKPCILGSGGGIILRGGWRSSGPLYIGGAYELTKQDPNKLYRIALLQQARAEARYYFATHRVTEPYVSTSLGVVGYGNEWKIDTFGPAGSIGGGVEYQVTQRTVIGIALGYRLAYFTRFTDTAGSSRAPGIAQLFGLDLVLEQRDAILTQDLAVR